MPDNAFVDSNIIIYAYSVDEPKKQAIARELLNTHEMIFISTQTINEFVNVTTRKKMLNNSQIAEVIDELFSVFSVETIGQNIIQKALVLSKIYRYSYFDCLMIASAISSDCSILYSEDMHHQQLIEDTLRIINPFQTNQ